VGVFHVTTQVTDCALQLAARVLGLQLLDTLDEVALLQATVTALVPVVEDFLQVAYLQLLQVHAVQIDLFLCNEQST